MKTSTAYKKLWNDAKETGNAARMEQLFLMLCNEAEIPDPEGDQAQAGIGKMGAELRNAKDKHEGGKVK